MLLASLGAIGYPSTQLCYPTPNALGQFSLNPAMLSNPRCSQVIFLQSCRVVQPQMLLGIFCPSTQWCGTTTDALGHFIYLAVLSNPGCSWAFFYPSTWLCCSTLDPVGQKFFPQSSCVVQPCVLGHILTQTEFCSILLLDAVGIQIPQPSRF